MSKEGVTADEVLARMPVVERYDASGRLLPPVPESFTSETEADWERLRGEMERTIRGRLVIRASAVAAWAKGARWRR